MPKRVFENPLLSTRYVTIHADFKPDGNPRDNLRPLMDLWIEVQSHLNRVRKCELRQRVSEQQKLGDAIDKLSPLVTSVLQGERDAPSIADDMLRLVPDEVLRRKVFDWYSDLSKQKPETRTPEERDAQEKELADRDKALTCGKTILDSLTRLSEATEKGEPNGGSEQQRKSDLRHYTCRECVCGDTSSS